MFPFPVISVSAAKRASEELNHLLEPPYMYREERGRLKESIWKFGTVQIFVDESNK
jgi:hypothetical protein